MLGEYLGLFASTEVFIFVFVEIVTKIETIQQVIFKKAEMRDYAVFIAIFGLFSIFGTYVGIPGNYGAICNIRDLAPMIAGLVAGPYVGVAVGLIGGIHRLFLGGDSAVACCLATVLAGLIAGLVYKYNNGKLIGIIPAMVFAVGIELLHASLALALVHPFTEAVDIVVTDIPAMIVANSLGLAISVIVIHSTKELCKQDSSE
ncbi:MAG: hypothetical protein MUE45_01445 [Methanoregulaceae archaeon]|jgi:sigma-B regulation protein RsbU (phosphoserine phosphatase)|nr:hypothetical protein [Methanoregulaceae archaeon]